MEFQMFRKLYNFFRMNTKNVTEWARKKEAEREGEWEGVREEEKILKEITNHDAWY